MNMFEQIIEYNRQYLKHAKYLFYIRIRIHNYKFHGMKCKNKNKT